MESSRKKLLKLVTPELNKLDVAHGLGHSLSVFENCKRIAKFNTKANLDVLYAASLLHDIGYTIVSGNEHSHHSVAIGKELLEKAEFKNELIDLILECVVEHDNFIFVKGHRKVKPKSLEAKIFQDADRLEGIGAMGIGRNFVWAGKNSKVMYNDKIGWKNHLIYGGNISVLHTLVFEMECYKNFNTKAAKALGKDKYLFMKSFVAQFIKEWKK
jgi:uncharacterized protein